MQNFNQNNTQRSLFSPFHNSALAQKQAMSHSLSSLASTDLSGNKQRNFEAEPELSQKTSLSDWNDFANNTSENDPNIKLSSAYFGSNQNLESYFEEFTTQEPIDFHRLKESSNSKYDEKSSSSSSLSKTSKKIVKIQKEDPTQHNTPKRSERSSKGKKNPWQPSEDAKVLELVVHYGQSWALVAAALGNRTGKQVRDRYLNYLRSDIKEEEFTVDEDRLLLSLYYQLGHKWSKIASQIPGRTECQVKNRFYAHIKKRLSFPDFPENKANYQKNMADIFFEDEIVVTNAEGENVFLYEEKKEVEFQEEAMDAKKEESHRVGLFNNNLNELTDGMISYENKNRNFTQISQTFQYSGSVFPRTTSIHENVKPDNFLSSFNNISSFCDEALFQTDAKVENELANSHKQALLCLESEVNNREKKQRYEELAKRKKALEFFYNKTLKEMSELELGDFSAPRVPN